jgi:hypothetical protein
MYQAADMLRDLANEAEAMQAIAAGDATLHNAIDYWQGRAMKAEAAQEDRPWISIIDIAHLRRAFNMVADMGIDQNRRIYEWLGAMLVPAPSPFRRQRGDV